MKLHGVNLEMTEILRRLQALIAMIYCSDPCEAVRFFSLLISLSHTQYDVDQSGGARVACIETPQYFPSADPTAPLLC